MRQGSLFVVFLLLQVCSVFSLPKEWNEAISEMEKKIRLGLWMKGPEFAKGQSLSVLSDNVQLHAVYIDNWNKCLDKLSDILERYKKEFKVAEKNILDQKALIDDIVRRKAIYDSNSLDENLEGERLLSYHDDLPAQRSKESDKLLRLVDIGNEKWSAYNEVHIAHLKFEIGIRENLKTLYEKVDVRWWIRMKMKNYNREEVPLLERMRKELERIERTRAYKMKHANGNDFWFIAHYPNQTAILGFTMHFCPSGNGVSFKPTV